LLGPLFAPSSFFPPGVSPSPSSGPFLFGFGFRPGTSPFKFFRFHVTFDYTGSFTSPPFLLEPAFLLGSTAKNVCAMGSVTRAIPSVWFFFFFTTLRMGPFFFLLGRLFGRCFSFFFFFIRGGGLFSFFGGRSLSVFLNFPLPS